jgi:hypothetical protein
MLGISLGQKLSCPEEVLGASCNHPAHRLQSSLQLSMASSTQRREVSKVKKAKKLITDP